MEENQSELLKQFIDNVRNDQGKPALDILKQVIDLKQNARVDAISTINNNNSEIEGN